MKCLIHFNLNTTVNNVFKITANLFKDCEFFICRNQCSLIKKINHLKWKENVIITTILHSQIVSKSVIVLTLSLVVMLMSIGVASSSVDMSMVL